MMLPPPPHDYLQEQGDYLEHVHPAPVRPIVSPWEALTRASRLLTVDDTVDLHGVLATMGQALGADCMFLLTVLPADDPAAGSWQIDDVIVWHVDGPEAAATWRSALRQDEPLLRHWSSPSQELDTLLGPPPDNDRPRLSIALSTPQMGLFGYVGLACGPRAASMEENAWTLRLLRDLFCGYLQRVRSVHTLRQMQSRFYHFVRQYPEPVCITLDGVIQHVNDSAAALLGDSDVETLLGRSLYDLVSAELHGTLQRRLEALQRGEAVPPMEYAIMSLEGTERIVEVASSSFEYGNRLAVATVLRDVTKSQQQIDRYQSVVDALAEAIWYVELEEPLPVNWPVAAQVNHILLHGHLTGCNPALARFVGTAETTPLLGRNVRMFLKHVDADVLGALVRGNYRLRDFKVSGRGTDAPRQFMISAVGTVRNGRLVAISGSATEVTEEHKVRHRLLDAKEAEQTRIGRELHDGVGQLLTGVQLLSDNLANRFSDNGEEPAEQARRIARYAQEASHALREIYRGLVPRILEHGGLTAALADLADTLNAVSDTRVTFEPRGVDVLDATKKLQLYRIAQEAANNALKHSRAASVRLTLERQEEIVLQIEDDGIGFQPGDRSDSSLGLENMRQRAHMIGARFDIDSEPGRGTTIRCMLPADLP